MAVAHHAKKQEPQVYNGVSEADVPSARFGWSELSRGTIQIAGWISVLFLVAFNFGNHQGHVETIWLITLAVLIALGLIIHATEPKLSQVRTVTAHNKPQGHREPDWAYDQKTLSGAYEHLDERQLRALNIDPARITHLRPQQQAVAAPVQTTERVEVVKVAPRAKHSR
ncbi:DUF2631 domain-containing protein [Corynebacterium aquatimens]|uniref:DUF2631 domain-containing protein n=1 Tax=Corynebacterium TaxID=1716 RepID=UPI001F4714C5|nr:MULTISPECIES: DUF2631 domain-containing protein [Corynebacterium]QYH19552.1 DUF2631 domain-containing protein [Corynebacterium aquatimens]UIZ91490.1 DUF2631 domain-containing protein [Corynebacterium sp. CNCTC7651]